MYFSIFLSLACVLLSSLPASANLPLTFDFKVIQGTAAGVCPLNGERESAREAISSEIENILKSSVFPVICERSLVNYQMMSYSEQGMSDFLNPERGWYSHTETSASNFVPLSHTNLLQLRQNEGITLLFRHYVLNSFVTQPITSDILEMISADFNIARSAFLKVILRFSYTTTFNDPPPRGDASKDIVLQHITQLKPILIQHSDVLLVLQHGFIGTWGEGYYTDHFGDSGIVTTQQWEDRQEVYDALLDSTEECTLIQVRTWNFKTRFTGTSAPISMEDAYTCGNSTNNVAANSRTGIHNDCFLASPTDFGTWDNSEIDRPLLSEHSQYTIIGGETCFPASSRNACPTALQELALFHFTYLNNGYHPEVLTRWATEGCNETISQMLGYRLVLLSSSFPSSTRRGCSVSFNLTIRNDGFAAPVHNKILKLFLEKEAENISLTVEGSNIDPRFWTGGGTEHDIQGVVQMPGDVESGDWSVYLTITDDSEMLQDITEYNVLFVNQPYSAIEVGRMNNLQRKLHLL